jgi:hypothetical protein
VWRVNLVGSSGFGGRRGGSSSRALGLKT